MGVPSMREEGAGRPTACTRRGFVALACACAVAAGHGAARRGLADEAAPETFEVDGILYAVLEDGQVGVGTGVQVQPDEFGDGLVDPGRADVAIPASVEHGGVTYAVTQIAPFAFQNAAMQGVSLPEGLVKIGKCAFQFCRQLAAVEVPASVELLGSYSFFGANSLAQVTFAAGSELGEIADGAFAVRKTSGSVDNADTTASLASIELPAKLRLLGAYAFYGQGRLASVAFAGESLNSISPYCFGLCTSLTRIDIPTLTSTIGRVGRYAFEGDAALEEVTFQGGVSGTQTTQTGNEFNGCTAVKTVVYYDKKWNAQNLGSNPAGSAFGTAFTMGVAGFDDAPEAREYYTVRQYASQADAQAGRDCTGYAAVPAGTAFHELSDGTCEALESEGFEAGAWAYEDASPLAGLADSCCAYPCDEVDLAFASMELEGAVNGDGLVEVGASDMAQGAPLTVWDAAGTRLEQDADYVVSYADELGSPVEMDASVPGGTYTLCVQGCGAYEGKLSAEFCVSGAAEAWTRLGADAWEGAMQLAARGVPQRLGGRDALPVGRGGPGGRGVRARGPERRGPGRGLGRPASAQRCGRARRGRVVRGQPRGRRQRRHRGRHLGRVAGCRGRARGYVRGGEGLPPRRRRRGRDRRACGDAGDLPGRHLGRRVRGDVARPPRGGRGGLLVRLRAQGARPLGGARAARRRRARRCRRVRPGGAPGML